MKRIETSQQSGGEMSVAEKLIDNAPHLWFEKVGGSINSDLTDINIRQRC